ncbi:hypothetical protein HELRODRAFT_170424 [Helobdella robusta]|uniref:Uncharacterized protein n=1 Tax=Helobdella robusta TaxID=6412 RepID=T1F315_HELRO|nr:hypothetical protein HELRODRAFT_170424 [Helobdella robusta]ESO07123.1 hypothetical protein HELRODRAFT_170424 [Helobdella robusta]
MGKKDKRGRGLTLVHNNLPKATLIADGMKYLGFKNFKLSDVFYDVLPRDVDDLTSAIFTSTTNLLNKYASYKRLSLRGSTKHPFPIGAINAIRTCRRLERQLEGFYSEITKIEYK